MNVRCTFGHDDDEVYLYFGLSLCEECLIDAERCPAEGIERTTAAIESYIHLQQDARYSAISVEAWRT